MKIAICGDIHMSPISSIYRSNGDKYTRKLENCIDSINWFEEVAKERGCQIEVYLGDFFDKPDLDSQTISALKEIKWNDLPKNFIVGNHEMGNNDLSFNSLNALSAIGKVISKPEIQCGFGYELLFLPYILESNRKSLKEYIQELWEGKFTTQEVKSRIILSHNDLQGIQYGQYISKQGFDIKEIDDYSSLFINGHLHNQTQINDKILNLGILTGQNFSEDGFKYSHSIAIVDTDTLKVDLINNPYAVNFYKLDLTLDNNIEEILSKCDNGVVTIRAYDKDIQHIKDIIKNYDILEYRMISVYSNTIEKQDVKEIVSVDHIKQYKEYCMNNIEDSDILREELSLLN